MFLITDTYGTHQWAFGRIEALAWLAAAGPDAQVRNVWGRVVASRSFSRAY